jgi:hypothetical protein
LLCFSAAAAFTGCGSPEGGPFGSVDSDNSKDGGDAYYPIGGGGGTPDAETPVISGQPQGGVYTLNTASVPLTVTVVPVKDSGVLSYQWYSSALDDNTAGTALSGETAAAYTPPTDTTGIFYYYVIVTNTLGSRKSATSSNTAEIKVNNLINAQVPNITGQPQGDVSYPCNTASPPALSVAVDPVLDSGTLSYQWYSNTNNSNTGGTPISGETAETYTPPTAAKGTFYYYVEVTNTISDNGDGGIKVQSVYSAAAAIDITVTDAQAPNITGQPQSASYPRGTANVALTVTATGGDLSYQWYRNTGNSNSGGIEVGTNSSSFPLPTDTEGIFYYYVKVTNTISDNGDGGNKTATLASGPAEVTVTMAWTSLAEIGPYLAGASGGSDTDHPVLLPVNMALSDANWTGILAAIETGGKYVALDLSACARGSDLSGNGLYSDGTFNLEPFVAPTGKDRIVSLTLPDAATSIAGKFDNFTSLTSVSGNVTHIGDSAFQLLSTLETINFPEATNIGGGAFWGCSALTAISLPVVQSIGDVVFSNSGLVSMHLPASLSYLGADPFERCTSLSSFTVDDANPNFSAGESGKMLMNKAGTVLSWPTASGSVDLPASVTGIGYRVFADNTALTAVDFPGVTSIGERAFDSSGLVSANFPKVQSIGEWAFRDCMALTTLNLPKVQSLDVYAFAGSSLVSANLLEVGSIGDNAFRSCKALTTLELPADPPGLGSGVFGDTQDSPPTTLSIKVPSGRVDAYKSAWGVANAVTEAGTSVYGYGHKRILITDAP